MQSSAPRNRVVFGATPSLASCIDQEARRVCSTAAGAQDFTDFLCQIAHNAPYKAAHAAANVWDLLAPEQQHRISAAARPLFAVVFLRRIAQRIDSLRHDEHEYGAIVAMMTMIAPSEPWLAAQTARAFWDRLSYRQRAAMIESAQQHPDFAASMLSLIPPSFLAAMDADHEQWQTLERLASAACDAQPEFAGRAAETVFDLLAPHARSALVRAAARHPSVAARLLTRMNAERLKMIPYETLKETARSAAKAHHCIDQTILCLWDALPTEMLVMLVESAIDAPSAAYEIVSTLGHRINHLLSCPQGRTVMPGILRAAQRLQHVIIRSQPLQTSPHERIQRQGALCGAEWGDMRRE